MEDSGVQVRVSGDVRGQVVVGDHNIVVSAERSVVTIVNPGQRPACTRRTEVELLPRRMRRAVGREEELAAITDALGADGPVQVHGQSGMGKSTLLRMAAHALSGRWDGVVFLDAAGRDVGDVLQDAFEACYDAPGYRPSPTELRRLMADVRVCLLLDDLTCDSHLLNTVLDTVREGRVLYSATERSLWGEGRTLALRGLRQDAALALLAQQFGRPLQPGEQPVAEALLRAAEGSPSQLLRAVAENRLRTPAELADLLPNLLTGLAGADREVVMLLGVAGAGGVSTGLLTELVPGAAVVGEVCERLVATGLAVPTMSGYRIATGAAEALPLQLRPDRSELAGLCVRLRSWVDVGGRPPAEVAGDGALISGVIEAAAGAGAAAEGARLARAAAPALACSLRLGVWGRILEHGRAAAERAREDGILAYLTHEDGIRHLVTGKRLAAAAAFATAAGIWQRLGDSDHAGAAEDAGELCGPDATSPSQPGTQDGAGSTDPSTSTEPSEVSSAGQDGASSAAQDAGTASGPGPDAIPDPSGGLASAPPVDPGTVAVGAKGMGLTAKLIIGGSLAAVTATGVVLGQQATAPDTVPTSVTVSTSVAEVTMPGEPKDDCLIKAGGTDCTTVVTSKKGTKGPVQVKPAVPLPDGVEILYWGCEEGAEAKSCTVQADKPTTVCISTTSPADKAARQDCAEATGSPRPVVRTEEFTVVPVNASGELLPSYTVRADSNDSPDLGDCKTSPTATDTDIVWCEDFIDPSVVCWVKSDRVTMLCGISPWAKTFRRRTWDEGVPATNPVADPQPWGMELADGTRCAFRHYARFSLPNNLVIAYDCDPSVTGGAGTARDEIYVVEGSHTPLLDKSTPRWTVQVVDTAEAEAAVKQGDNVAPTRREVTKVYFAGRS